MAEVMPWDLPWLKHIKAPEQDDSLKQETLAMLGDLPEVDPATINPTSEVVVRAPSLAPEGQPEIPTLPWELDWESPASSAPVASVDPEPTDTVPVGESEQIAVDEGTFTDRGGNHLSYLDSTKKLHGGRGHLLTEEEAKLYPLGAKIPDEVVDQWFAEDTAVAERTADRLIGDIEIPDEVRNILINMAFNIGQDKLSGFKKMWAAIEAGNWETAADEMVDSKWFDQVGNRSDRLVARMRGVGATGSSQTG